jgi:hypothetical protein
MHMDYFAYIDYDDLPAAYNDLIEVSNCPKHC